MSCIIVNYDFSPVVVIGHITVSFIIQPKWSSLYARRYTHWLCFIYKVLLGLAPTYLSVLLTKNHSHYGLRLNDVLHLVVPRVKTELGKKAFMFAAPSAWNLLQKSLKMTTFTSYKQFVSMLKNREQEDIGQCNCSYNCINCCCFFSTGSL